MSQDVDRIELTNAAPATIEKAEYARTGRVHIPDFLSAASADAIYRHLASQPDWNFVCKLNGRHIDSSENATKALDEAQRSALLKEIRQQARDGFQYNYAAIPIYDIVHQKLLPGDYFYAVFEFLNSAEFLDYARELCDDPSIAFADAQATKYSAGHFLTTHSDDAPGKNRRAAYVLNLTPRWRADWGGGLQFFDKEGHVEAAFLPRFNALNIFAVPADHSVAYVAPFAGESRYSITGWFRSGDDPGPG